jgi:hypothetical protein
MRNCSDYEIELSALLDGESNPSMAVQLVEHVATCESCSSFVRELSSTQAIIEGLHVDTQPETGPAAVQSIETKRRRVLGLSPQWAIGMAAALLLTVSIWFGAGVGTQTGFTNDIRDGELVIRLEEDKGRMSEERFVAMVSELLRADRRYQNEMYVVLDEITQSRSSGESRSPASGESSSPLTAAME